MQTPYPLEKRRLGKTHMVTTAMNLGGAGLGGIFGDVTDSSGVAAVEKALELGMNWLDTSPYYFEAERRMGLALRGVPREHFYISTKVGTNRERYLDYSADATLWSIDRSLQKLGVDYLDIALIHDPLPEHLDQALAPRGALEALVNLKIQGVIKAIGIGVQSHDLIRRAIDTDKLDMALTVNDYTLFRQSVLDGVCKYAQPKGIGIVNGAPLAMGLLSGRDPLQIGTYRWTPPKDEVAAALQIHQWCSDRKVDVLSLALQFSLRQPQFSCTLIGAASPEEVQSCFQAASEPIPDEIWNELPQLLEKVRL